MKKGIVLTGLALLLSSSGIIAQSNREGTNESRFGTNGGVQQFPRELQKAGVGISREWILWEQIEPAKGRFNWSAMDEKVRIANSAGIEILGYFTNMPAWAKRDKSDFQFFEKKNEPAPNQKNKAFDFSAPKDINDFREFAKAVAQRYDGRHGHGLMRYIEILNEVTFPPFFDLKNTDYEPWLITGFEGVKEGNPQAKVLIGGFVDPLDVRKFVDRMLKNYHQYFDIVNFHSYSRNDEKIIESTQYIKGRMKLFGVNKPIWITETGTLASPEADGGDWRGRVARGVVKRYVMAFGEGIEKVFWWPLLAPPARDEYSDTASRKPEKMLYMALAWGRKAVREFHSRPAYTAYGVMTSKLNGFSSVRRIAKNQYEFSVNGRNVLVLWCDGGGCSIPSELSGTVKVTDYMGREEIKPASGIVLTPSPVIVERIG